MKTQAEIRRAFWELYRDNHTVSKKKITHYSGKGTMYDTDTRCAFVDYVDMLAKDGVISKSLAERVTL